MNLTRLLAAAVLLVAAFPSVAAMQAKPVEWRVGKDRFSGYLVYDDAVKTRRPGLAMVPDWLGVTPEAVVKAKQQAGRDYVILVVDMYGRKLRPKNDKQALAQVSKLYAAPQTLRARIGGAIDALKAQAATAPVDGSKIGAFGFCMGGTTVLELARAGTHPEVRGVVSFHGGLQRRGEPAASIGTPMLVLNGSRDKEMQNVLAFQQEMDDAQADWTLVNFAGAEHCFALEGKDRDGCRYQARAAERAFEMMHAFFRKRFAD